MYKYICLLPLYDDWESLEILLAKINTQMESVGKKVTIIIVNDFSNLKPPKFKPQSNIDKITILNLKINLGSQKAISIGLSYLSKINEKMIVTILDSDGEDDVNKIPEMMKKAEMYNDKIIVSTRTKRNEHYLFQLFYILHKILTFIFTLKWISFGNFSSFDSSMIKKILSNNRSWLAYSGCIAKNCRIYKIQAERKKRLIKQSIDNLKRAAKTLNTRGKQAELYQQVYDKLLKGANTIQEVEDRAAAVNLDAVQWMTNKWSEYYPELRDVSLKIYNTVLDEDINYTPDTISSLELDRTEDIDRPIYESPEYLKHTTIVLSPKNRLQALIPPNFLTGHLALSKECVLHYKFSYKGLYPDVKQQISMKWNDNRINIRWPITNPILSKRDR